MTTVTTDSIGFELERLEMKDAQSMSDVASCAAQGTDCGSSCGCGLESGQ
jgi:hypothetical protein